MNLSTVSLRPNLPFRPLKAKDTDPSPAPSPAPDPAPAPAPAPQPGIDFSVVDTPKKAALLPMLNAAALLVNAQIMMQAVQGGFAIKSALTYTMGDDNTKASITHTLDPQTPAVSGEGDMAGAPFQEGWSLDPSGSSINVAGTIGGSAEAIAFTIADDGAHLDGKIGDMDFHQLINQQGDGDDAKLVFDGTLGGTALHQELSIKQDDPSAPPTINVVGKLGDDDISYSESITDAQDTSLTLTGSGNIAGTAVNLSHTLSIVDGGGGGSDPDPNPPDDPTPPPGK